MVSPEAPWLQLVVTIWNSDKTPVVVSNNRTAKNPMVPSQASKVDGVPTLLLLLEGTF